MQGWRRRVVESVSESGWLLPLVGAVAGVLLALAFGLVEQSPAGVSWTVTVGEGRGALLSWLSVLFAAFSIVLALAAVVTQNVMGKYSGRMYRLYARNASEKYVLALFAMTAGYVVTEQILLQGADPDSVAPATGFIVAFVLLIATGVAMIWYISTAAAWFRLDRVTQVIAERVLREATADDQLRFSVVPAPPEAFDRPQSAVAIHSHGSGFLVEPDPSQIMSEIADSGTTAVVASPHGSPIVDGEEIGWIDGLVTRTGVAADAERVADRIGQIIETEPESGLTGGMVGYGIVVLVDTAIKALSPAVNDPNTAVQIIGTMTFIYEGLAHNDLGSYQLRSTESASSVVVRSPSFGEYLHLGTDQILLYGQGDPAVVHALGDMVHSLLSLDLADPDRREVEGLGERLAAAAGTV